MSDREGVRSIDCHQRPTVGVAALSTHRCSRELVVVGGVESREGVGEVVVAVESEAVGIVGAEVDKAEEGGARVGAGGGNTGEAFVVYARGGDCEGDRGVSAGNDILHRTTGRSVGSKARRTGVGSRARHDIVVRRELGREPQSARENHADDGAWEANYQEVHKRVLN